MNEAPDEDNPTGSAPVAAEGPDDDAAVRSPEGDSEASEGAEAREAEASEASEVRAEKVRRRKEPTRPPAAPLPPVSRGLRSLYWALWFVLAALVLASVCVWALTPSSGE
ncbi:MAG TPA: hypothetical protein PLR99_31535, partial [Polyangiaceae bacterium]|nr:hypothetical protein [Polyangiaceae bacterium]